MQRKSTVETFIEKERAKGTTDQKIRHQLLDAGWQMDIIKRVMEPDELITQAARKPAAAKKLKTTLKSKLWKRTG
ncbi:MAG: hypothetical protein ACR2FM_02355 [Candidatus Saccharimonadales bacterium]